MRLPLPRIVVAGSLLVAGHARADGGDHSAAEALVEELGRDALHEPIVAEPVAHARQALERAVRLRELRDEVHAQAADGLALEWAHVARDLARAADAEAKAAEVRRKALDEQVQLERTRALVDEGIARVGRLRAELDEAERTRAGDVSPDRRAVEVHAGDPKPTKKAARKATPPKPGNTGSAP